jgi:hypothetical protein
MLVKLAKRKMRESSLGFRDTINFTIDALYGTVLVSTYTKQIQYSCTVRYTRT